MQVPAGGWDQAPGERGQWGGWESKREDGPASQDVTEGSGALWVGCFSRNRRRQGLLRVQ